MYDRTMNQKLTEFKKIDLSAEHFLLEGALPTKLVPMLSDFENLWGMHPPDFHEIKIHGHLVKTPRWQQAYGRDYQYTGRTNRALPIPPSMNPLLRWSQENIDNRLN